jgi:hypothetical protein
MARHLKNTEINSGSKSIRLPQGTTATRPTSSVDGQIRFNESTQRYEGYVSNVALSTGSNISNRWFPFAFNNSVQGTTIQRESFTIWNTNRDSTGTNIGGGAISSFTLEFDPTTFTYTGNYDDTTHNAFQYAGANSAALFTFLSSNSNISVTSTNGSGAAFAVVMGVGGQVGNPSNIAYVTFGNINDQISTNTLVTTYVTGTTATNGANVITSYTTGSTWANTVPQDFRNFIAGLDDPDDIGSPGRGFQVGDKIVVPGSQIFAGSNLTINVTGINSTTASDLYRLTTAPATVGTGDEANVMVFIGGLYQHPRRNYFLTTLNDELYIDISGASFGTADPLNGVDLVVIYNVASTL